MPLSLTTVFADLPRSSASPHPTAKRGRVRGKSYTRSVAKT